MTSIEPAFASLFSTTGHLQSPGSYLTSHADSSEVRSRSSFYSFLSYIISSFRFSLRSVSSLLCYIIYVLLTDPHNSLTRNSTVHILTYQASHCLQSTLPEVASSSSRLSASRQLPPPPPPPRLTSFIILDRTYGDFISSISAEQYLAFDSILSTLLSGLPILGYIFRLGSSSRLYLITSVSRNVWLRLP